MEEVSSPNNDDTKKIFHELQVHECELELQKEELEHALDHTVSATALYDLAPSGFLTLSRESLICQLNLGAAKLLGRERSALLNISFMHFIDKEVLAVYNNFLRNVFESGEKQNCEVRLTLEETPSAFVYLEGHISGDNQKCLITAVDITERKQTEKKILESEKRLNRAEIASKTGNWELHLDTKMMIGSEGAQKIYGVAKDQFEFEVIKNIPLPEYRPMMDTALKNLIEEDKPYNLEFKIKTADTGEIKHLNSIATFDKEKRILFGVIQDITESKRAEEAIKLNEARLESLLRINEHYAESIKQLLDFTLNEAITLTSSKFGYIYLYDEIKQEFTLNTWSKEVMDECRVQQPELIYYLGKTGLWGEAVRQRKPIMVNDFPNANPLKKGLPEGHVMLDKSLTLPVFSEERIVAVIGVANKQDNYTDADIRQLNLMMDSVWKIVQHKISDAALSESKDRFRNLFENLPVGNSMTGLDGSMTVNRAFCDMLGYTEEELKSKNWNDITYSEDIERTNGILNDLQDGKIKQVRFEKRYIHKNGNIIWTDVASYLQKDQEDKPQYYITNINNITEQKQAEQELRDSEEQLRITLNSIGDGVITTDSEGKVRQMNPVAEQLTGWTEKEATGKSLEEVFAIINEETRAAVEIPVRRVIREGTVVGLANHTLLIAKDSSERPIADSGAPIRNKEGEIIGLVLVFRDQSEERKAQFTLKESEKRFKLLYENAPLSYQSLDTNARLIDVNQTWLATLGYNREEVIGRSFGDFMTPESAELIKERFSAFIAAGEIHDYQFEMVRKDGTLFTVSYEGRIGQDELGHFNQTHCIFTDITERKRAEAALTKLRLQMEMILNSAGEGIFGLDLDGKLTFVNPAAANMIGWPTDQLPGKNHHEISHHSKPDGTTYPANECKIHASFKDGKTHNVTDEVFWRKDGTSFPVEYSSSPMCDEQGRLMGAVVTFSDITERKKVLKELRENEEAYRQISDAVSDYVFSSSTDENGCWIPFWIAGAFEKITGYNLEEYKACGGWHARLHPDDAGIDERDLEKLHSNQRISSEVRTIRKDGSELWVQVYANPVMNSDGTELIGIKGAVQDINDRKKAEIELIDARGNAEKRKNYYETIINNMGDPVFVKDDQSRLLLANDAFCTIFDLSRTEIIGKTLAEDVTPDEKEIFLRIDMQVLADGLDNINEESLTVRDGHTRTISTRKSRFIDNDGKKYLIGVIRDITERKQAEEELLKLKNELELIVDEKTKELKERVAELERFYNATIDRELRMKELRDEIEQLKSDKL